MTPRTVLSLVLVAVLATGCAGLTVPDREDSPDSSVSEPKRSAKPSKQDEQPAGQTFEEDVALARDLTEKFWEQRFQAAGRSYRPLTRFEAYSGNDGPDCGGQPSVPENAFYCPVGHFVAYDADWMRGLYDQLGDGSVYVIVPHEIGHAVQAQLMSDFSFSVERELQADCYAGGALGGLVQGGQLQAEDGDEDELMTNLAAAGDPTDAWWREDAHGTAAQRQQSFAGGYNNGVDSCGSA
ncbi:hypothetical protein GCM10009677_35590 [Sphaerisporangium rubeum]|uniref:Metalloprotease n=1 Tax=Sphaerisporangium rubeum TaxID=321317 RepID=A0A7X0IB04_9ACTN|nr:hypothetical protein [Sphaerisporangium rubeum]